MIPPKFEYASPTSIEEALTLLADTGEEAKVLSGGQSLLPLLKLRLASPKLLVDINRLPDLDDLEDGDGGLYIGALVRESHLERSHAVKTRYPILADTAAVVADPLVRNRATVCGNLAHADPANDHPATMLTLDAEVVARGPGGERSIPIDGFFTGFFSTALEPGELMTAIRIPSPEPRSGGAYIKMERKVGDFATAAVAARVVLAADGSIEKARVALTNVGPTPLRATEAEEHLRGKAPEEAVLAEAGRLAAGAAQPTSDQRGSADYKRDLVRVLTVRALRRALERAGNGASAAARPS